MYKLRAMHDPDGYQNILKNDWVVYTQKTTHDQMLHLDARGQNDYEYEGRTTKFANFRFTRLGRIFSK